MGFCMGFFCVSQNGQRGNAAEKLHKTAKTAQIISIQAVFVGAAGQIRTADLVITKIADAPLTGIRSCYKMPKSIENKGLFLNVYFTMC